MTHDEGVEAKAVRHYGSIRRDSLHESIAARAVGGDDVAVGEVVMIYREIAAVWGAMTVVAFTHGIALRIEFKTRASDSHVTARAAVVALAFTSGMLLLNVPGAEDMKEQSSGATEQEFDALPQCDVRFRSPEIVEEIRPCPGGDDNARGDDDRVPDSQTEQKCGALGGRQRQLGQGDNAEDTAIEGAHAAGGDLDHEQQLVDEIEQAQFRGCEAHMPSEVEEGRGFHKKRRMGNEVATEGRDHGAAFLAEDACALLLHLAGTVTQPGKEAAEDAQLQTQRDDGGEGCPALRKRHPERQAGGQDCEYADQYPNSPVDVLFVEQNVSESENTDRGA